MRDSNPLLEGIRDLVNPARLVVRIVLNAIRKVKYRESICTVRLPCRAVLLRRTGKSLLPASQLDATPLIRYTA